MAIVMMGTGAYIGRTECAHSAVLREEREGRDGQRRVRRLLRCVEEMQRDTSLRLMRRGERRMRDGNYYTVVGEPCVFHRLESIFGGQVACEFTGSNFVPSMVVHPHRKRSKWMCVALRISPNLFFL